ncbi:hypothetical protein GCM10027040_33180 [Halomonas shantousis]
MALAGAGVMLATVGTGPVAAERVPLTIAGEHVVNVELARNPVQRAHGLMDRDHLPEDAGMLFLYRSEQPPQAGFWMHRTRIPLDIAFIGADGEIRAIDHMMPCGNDVSTRCPSYRAGVPFRAALEVNAGYFDAHDIEVGDHVALEKFLDTPPTGP